MTLTKKEPSDDSITYCVHCHKRITSAHILGLSLICPSCGKPYG